MASFAIDHPFLGRNNNNNNNNYQARGFFGGRGGIEQSTPRISARSFTVPRMTSPIFPARYPRIDIPEIWCGMARGIFGGRGGTEQFTPRISTCVFFELGFGFLLLSFK